MDGLEWMVQMMLFHQTIANGNIHPYSLVFHHLLSKNANTMN